MERHAVTEPSPLAEAQRKFADAVPFRATGAVACALAEALGHTLYTDVTAPHDLPPYPRAIVEGYVVHAEATRDASEDAPVSFRVAGEVRPGDGTFPELKPGQAVQVATGSILPDGPVAVARMWEARREGDTILVSRPFPPRFFAEEQGEEFAAGAVVLPASTVLEPAHIGTIASFGIERIEVARAPRVTLFSSGDEVIPYPEPMRPGAIRDSNAPMLAAAVRQAGGSPAFGGIMRDDFDAFVATARKALKKSDMLLISGGTAVGGRDFISDLVRAVGDLLVDGVPMKSGRPLIMGVADGKPVVCVAGHPPEALRGFRLFGSAAIDRLLGRNTPLPEDG